MSDSMWILTGGTYSSYHVIGTFRTKEQADAVAAEINDADTGYDEYQVEEVPYLDDLRVETVDTTQRHYLGVRWDGTVRYESANEPIVRRRIVGLPDAEGAHYVEPWPTCQVTLSGFEANYTLGVYLDVRGTDIERVNKVYSEQRAQLLANAAIETVRLWHAKGYLPPWVWGRDENRGLLDALEAAGFDRINNGPIGS